MNSMTGFGRAEAHRKDYRLQIELSAVNSRYLECVFRMPRSLAAFENEIKELIAKNISRGKLTVTVNLEETPEAAAEALIDMNAAETFYRHIKRLQKKLKLKGEIEINHILSNVQYLMQPEMGLIEEKVWPDLKKLLLKALSDLKKMRAAEGSNLKKDMLSRLKVAGDAVKAIEKQSPLNVDAYRKRLEKRIGELGNGMNLDPRRLAEEVTIYAERSDVTEECTRLRSHIKMYSQTMTGDGDSGKRMNFIIQEMGREANTISSKALSTETAALAIALKEEIEKLREQVQNIE